MGEKILFAGLADSYNNKWTLFFSGAQAESHTHIENRRKPMNWFFSWLSWLAVLLVGAYARDHIAGSSYNSSPSRVFWSWPLTKCWFSIGSRAHVSLTCCKQGRIVRKPVNLSPRLKFIRIITFSSIQMFFFLLCSVYGYYKTQNRKPNNKQKTWPQGCKRQLIKILPFPGLP